MAQIEFVTRTEQLSTPDGPPAVTAGALVMIGGKLYTTSALDGALTQWTVGSTGALTPGTTGAPAALARLLGGIMIDGAAAVVTLTASGLMIGDTPLTPQVALAATPMVSTPLSGGGQALFFAAADGGLLRVTLDKTGTPTAQTHIADTETAFSGDLQALTTFTIGAETFLAGVSSRDTGLTLWRVDASGQLVEASSLPPDEGLWISAPTALTSQTIGSNTYLIVGAAGSSSLTVLQVDDGGGLKVVDHVMDDLFTRFGGVQSVASVNHKGQIFIIAGGADDGISVLQLLPSGRLIARAHLADTLDAGLQNISAITATSTAQGIIIHVASTVEGGLTTLTWTTDGRVITNNGKPTDGDDIIVDRNGASILSGGGGADIFVMAADRNVKIITDFDLGTDKIDLSSWGMIRSLAQLTITATDDGFLVTDGVRSVIVHTTAGTPVSADMLHDTDLINLTHIPVTLPKTPVAVPPTLPDGVLIGTGGNDTLIADDSGMVLYGFEGHDILIGGKGNDILVGGDGNDRLEATAGNNILIGGFGNSTLIGGTGNDIMVAGPGGSTLIAGGGNNILYDGAGSDRMVGGPGANIFVMARDSYRDVIEGFTLGKDRIDLTSWGVTSLAALSITQTATGATIRYGAEVLDINTTSGTPLNPADFGYDDLFVAVLPAPFAPTYAARGQTFVGTATSEVLSGTMYNDVIRAGGGNDTIFGWAGDDRILGGVGDDWLIGGTGADEMYGGPGDDKYHVDDPGDLVIENPNEGNDTVYAEISYTLPDNVENLRLMGTANLHGIGNALDNLIVGNSGDNYLEGGDGNDWLAAKSGTNILYGGAGRDWLVGGSGRDTFVYKSITDSLPGQANRDLINSFTRGQDKIDLSAIDANMQVAGHQTFTFIEAAPFSNTAGELRYASWDMGWLIVEADVNGDGRADMQIFVNLIDAIGAEDFIL
ncbi:Hemolysin-type calcium-binding region [Ketogulonicigenium robustum]|uniref:Hemolysin-type calcium-binding region n=1 Tax=Ketogulonicigenium robustum TaxID=92947 RepID=A0A1W6P2C5_9RHOB|nr:calcium-binding protein [Ketogulonicigenium robustum]ARO15480.1 Hemolysin-type calcium-binding region [Ketogulonicigenium robustum]